MMALINTLTNCSLTNYSLRKKIYKEEIKTEKGLENFFLRHFEFCYQNITKSG